MLPDLHTDFSRGRSGGLVFPSLSEFSTVYCDPHSQRWVFLKNSVSTCSFTSSPPVHLRFLRLTFHSPFFLLLYGRTHFKDWHRVQPGELFFFYILIPYLIFALLSCFVVCIHHNFTKKGNMKECLKILMTHFWKCLDLSSSLSYSLFVIKFLG